MIGGGAIQGMKQSVDDNRSLLKSRKSLKSKLEDKGYNSLSKHEAKIHEKIDEKKLQAIKDKIRRDAKRKNIILLVSFIISFVAVCAVMLFLIQ